MQRREVRTSIGHIDSQETVWSKCVCCGRKEHAIFAGKKCITVCDTFTLAILSPVAIVVSASVKYVVKKIIQTG